MAKGNVLLKIVGVLIIIIGVLGILWAMYYGFLGALGLSEMGKVVITGLLILYGLYGIFTGFFQIAVGAIAFRHSKIPEHGTRCIVWGGIILILGIFLYVLLRVTAGMIHVDSDFYPKWYGSAIVITNGMVLPVLMILGGVLNLISAKQQLGPAGSAVSGNAISADSKSEKEGPSLEAKTEVMGVEAAASDMEEVNAGTVSEEKTVEGISDTSGVNNISEKPEGRLAYLQSRRLSREVDPRVKRIFK